ncbi:3-mercaptopyruvate sulfurtransferase [Pseudovibrio sp. W64]|uniref:3-mercaptopyruvate sulfurtransferase n=1 Tax=unclassified Pseudovibrio TaxID=2627060 RepID=UPI0007AE8D22|nr:MULTISPECIES: 3-mercaptopyruvate sulfurtransferase [unclassified Pseudovibrio]KZK76354.1 3-mercaptopyruvate sulfurtransferase [Pseudovibrio sp. W64]KZK82198.1 3-mercaptopyruvate sulfurtransferase [Pseudovibrio sp. Ad13]KZL02836.1 3-mercaptopyruvate sulfurtransferase [Pseudovibrio sp. W74]KZL07539.1 3-mercaptopyruvate sulfurtransferase [Pseudovibrio sp. Ad14]
MAQDPIVSTSWLKDHLDAPDVVIIDASWYLPAMERDAKKEYEQEHIPGALFMDIDDVSDQNSPLPHMMPEPHVFSSKMRKMGIGDGQTIVLYDGMGIFSAARVWWMFRAFGVKSVFVLDGGLPAWKEEGYPVSDEVPARMERHFTAMLNNDMVRNLNEVQDALETSSHLVLDARAPERFKGLAPEPREGVRAGHMPGALNLPFGLLLNDGKLRSKEDLQNIFAQAGVDATTPVITSCGSGVTAAVITLALEQVGFTKNALYDGSWTEWGSSSKTEVISEPA